MGWINTSPTPCHRMVRYQSKHARINLWHMSTKWKCVFIHSSTRSQSWGYGHSKKYKLCFSQIKSIFSCTLQHFQVVKCRPYSDPCLRVFPHPSHLHWKPRHDNNFSSWNFLVQNAIKFPFIGQTLSKRGQNQKLVMLNLLTRPSYICSCPNFSQNRPSSKNTLSPQNPYTWKNQQEPLQRPNLIMLRTASLMAGVQPTSRKWSKNLQNLTDSTH